MYKIAAFSRDIDSLLMRLDPSIYELYFLVPINSREEKWISSFIDEKHIIFFTFDQSHGYITDQYIDFILTHSDIYTCLKEKEISYLLVTQPYTDELNKWGKRHAIQLMYSPPQHQINLENKLWFDGFMQLHTFSKPQTIICKTIQELENIPFNSYVIQIPQSNGSLGTFIINSKHTLANVLKLPIIKQSDAYVVREYIQGKTYGISVFISSTDIVISTLRLQCFDTKNNGSHLSYIGLQWVDTKTLNKTLISKLNSIFTHMGILLRKQGFYGFANFDFIVDASDNVFILECNPRFSDASIMMIKFPELVDGIDITNLFLHDYLHWLNINSDPHIHSIPDVSFKGAFYETDINTGANHKRITIQKEYNIGVYTYKDDTVMYATPDIRALRKNDQFIYFSESQTNESYTDHVTVQYFLSTFPLYDENGVLNDNGKRIANEFVII